MSATPGIDVLDEQGGIACPTCCAPASGWCWTRTGARAANLHRARLRLESPDGPSVGVVLGTEEKDGNT